MNRETVAAGLRVDEISTIWRVPKGTIYRYAHKYRWRRYIQNGGTYYHPNDVAATFDTLSEKKV
ncbi:hypothetical protein [Micromonospora endophytica]|uniref:Uncharacterized protein n=1 Tax=Micromonospora endophytica TaxID=515350 RepID=A0A2W2CRJ8_9ACTN|nr:hypothetical protein [Micromonospora endophytica]PZG00541.1 hypothetical protein C1I93_02150 [Micromonospora endophytica]RIW45808.1 hypothetical protein D3H59_13925 [Micromonospora endophytica]BCJ61944.1 hypothetical protein Jiend_53660 [Micromonospora endophytica]